MAARPAKNNGTVITVQRFADFVALLGASNEGFESALGRWYLRANVIEPLEKASGVLGLP